MATAVAQSSKTMMLVMPYIAMDAQELDPQRVSRQGRFPPAAFVRKIAPAPIILLSMMMNSVQSFAMVDPSPRFGFVPFAETWNGRLAMLGFVIGLATELLTGQSILQQIGLG